MKKVTKDEAREIFKNDPYKLELIEEHSEDDGGLTIYRQGEYVDLCRGPHVHQLVVFISKTWITVILTHRLIRLLHRCVQSNLCLEIALPTKPLQHFHDENGEIALCTLSAFNLGKLDDLDELDNLADLAVRALDALLDYQDYLVQLQTLLH